MRFLYFTIAIFLVFVSCTNSNEKVNIPEDLIPRDTLVSIIFDVHIADAYLANNRLPSRNLNKNDFYAGIFLEHGYTRSKFDSTIEFLSKHPDYYIEIYEDVIKEMSLFEADIEKDKALEKKKKEEEREKKKEYYESIKVNSLQDTVKENNDHDSIFMERVSKAKERFNDRKKNRITSKDSLGVKNK